MDAAAAAAALVSGSIVEKASATPVSTPYRGTGRVAVATVGSHSWLTFGPCSPTVLHRGPAKMAKSGVLPSGSNVCISTESVSGCPAPTGARESLLSQLWLSTQAEVC